MHECMIIKFLNNIVAIKNELCGKKKWSTEISIDDKNICKLKYW